MENSSSEGFVQLEGEVEITDIIDDTDSGEDTSEAGGRRRRKAKRAKRKAHRKDKRARRKAKRKDRKAKRKDKRKEKLRKLGVTEEEMKWAVPLLTAFPFATPAFIFAKILKKRKAKKKAAAEQDAAAEEGTSADDTGSDTGSDSDTGAGAGPTAEAGSEDSAGSSESESGESGAGSGEGSDAGAGSGGGESADQGGAAEEEEEEEDEAPEDDNDSDSGDDGSAEGSDHDTDYGFDATFSEFAGDDFSSLEGDEAEKAVHPKVMDVANRMVWHKEKVHRLMQKLNDGNLSNGELNQINDLIDNSKNAIHNFDGQLHRYHGGLGNAHKPGAFKEVRAAKYLAEKKRGERLYGYKSEPQVTLPLSSDQDLSKLNIKQDLDPKVAGANKIIIEPQSKAEGEDQSNANGEGSNKKLMYVAAGLVIAAGLIWANKKYKFIKF